MTCVADEPPGTPCTDQATAFARGMCVHEHLREGWLCGRHLTRQSDRLCRVCHDLGHDCPLVFEPIGVSQ